MRLLEVHASPVRLFLFGVAGLVLMVAATDVMWLHRVSTPPEQIDGVLTTKGMNQRRADYLWGVPMLAAGLGLFSFAVVSLVRREPVLVVRDDGVEFQVGPPGGSPGFLPWNSIADVHSASEPDPDGGPPGDVVIFVVLDPGPLSATPWDAEWDGYRLKVNASGWERRPEEVVVHARLALEAWRRGRRHQAADGG